MDRQIKKAALYSVLAYFIMAFGVVAWKSVIGTYTISQILALEALVCLPLFIGLAKRSGGLHLLGTAYPFLQALRGIVQALAAYIGLYGLIHLPVSTYTMLGYCTPLIVTFSGWLFFKEKCPPIGWLCIVIGFVGTALIIQPEYTQNFIAALAVILSCCFWAANIVLMKKMPKDHIISFPFYTLMIVGSLSCMITLAQGVIPMTLFDFSIAAIAGVCFFVGAQILFSTYRLAPLYFLTPFQYTQIVWVVVLSYLIWAEIPTFIQMIGLIVVVTAATYSSSLSKMKS